MSDNFSKLIWETIEKQGYWNNQNPPFDGNSHTIKRAKVIGGWLIDKTMVFKRTFNTNNNIDVETNRNTSITFIPDPNHNWTL